MWLCPGATALDVIAISLYDMYHGGRNALHQQR